MQKTSIEIVEKLKSHGFEAYWAGGTVRDMLLGQDPKDYDIVTSAKPEEIEEVLEHTIPIGKKFGVILAVKNGHHFEVATFRSDAGYSDGRRPDAVYFTHAEDDAMRRDFTINGMFYEPTEKKLLDFVGGENDLKEKTLRFIGNPEERIKEDNLRILRAIRFKNSLGLKYTPGTFEAIKENAYLLENISAERIHAEIDNMLLSLGRVEALRELDNAGILNLILPEVVKMKGVKQPEKYHKEGDVFEHTLLALNSLPKGASLELIWGVLLHDIGKPDTMTVDDRIRFNSHAEVGAEMVFTIGKRLRFSKEFTTNVGWLVAHHMMAGDVLKMKSSRQAHWIHMPFFSELLELLKADTLGTKPKDLSLYHSLKSMSDRKEELLLKPERFLSGDDIMKVLGIDSGPEIGKLLDAVWHAQLEDKVKNRDEALSFVKKIIEKGQWPS